MSFETQDSEARGDSVAGQIRRNSLKTQSLLPLAFTLASIASAQTGQYPGLGVLSSGTGDIGAHSGEQLDLRFYGEVDAIYDTGLQPFSINSQGQLLQVNGLAGMQAAAGVYGVHTWRRAQLAIDYRGTSDIIPTIPFTTAATRRFILAIASSLTAASV